MSFIAFNKLGPSPVSQLDLNISPLPFASDPVIRSILKKLPPINPLDPPSKKISWKAIEKEISVLDPTTTDAPPEERLEALRKDPSLRMLLPTDPNMDPSKALSLFSATLRQDVMIAPFIPKEATEVLSSKDLTTISHRIRRQPKTEVLLNYFYKYFLVRSKECPRLIGDAIDLLLMNNQIRVLVKNSVLKTKIDVDESKMSECEAKMEKISSNQDLQTSLFFKISQFCKRNGLLSKFVGILLDLIPLREVIGIRFVFDLIAISEAINKELPQEAQFSEIEELYETHHLQSGKFLNSWFGKIQVYLESFTKLNLLDVEIQNFPILIVKHLPNIKSLTLSRVHLNSLIFKNLCKFPNLEHLNLSSSSLSANDLKFIFADLKTIKNLKTIDLLNNPIHLSEISEIQEYCLVNHIELLLPLDKKKQDYERILAANSESIETLNLSNLSIETLPEDLIERLSRVSSVIFRYSLASPSQTLEIMKTLLTKLPSATLFDFSSNTLSPAAINSLVDVAQEKAPNARIIRDLSKAELDLILAIERIREDVAAIDVEIPKKFRNSEDLWQQIQPSLEAQKETFAKIKNLDFSKMDIGPLPAEFIAYFPNVKWVSLHSSYPKKGKWKSSFNSLLALPKLEEINLSNNYITASMFANLKSLIENPEKSLDTIIISDCRGLEEDFEYFCSLCEKHDVELVFDEDEEIEVQEDSKRKREFSNEEAPFAKLAKTDS